MNILLKLKRYIMSSKERKNKNSNEIFKNVEAQNGNPIQFKKNQERISKEIQIFQEEQVEIKLSLSTLLSLSTILSSYHNNLHPNLHPSKQIKISLPYLIHKYSPPILILFFLLFKVRFVNFRREFSFNIFTVHNIQYFLIEKLNTI